MISEKAQIIYDYIVGRISIDISPTIREIATDLNIKSLSTVHKYVKELCDAGVIQKHGNHGRTIKLTGKKAMQIPILGTVAAGAPITAVEDILGYIPYSFNRYEYKDLFALKIQGDSMVNAGIFEGDIVVVHKTNVVNDGEIVVALIDDEATVKTFYHHGTQIRLQPENDSYEPIILDEVIILGRIVSMVREY